MPRPVGRLARTHRWGDTLSPTRNAVRPLEMTGGSAALSFGGGKEPRLCGENSAADRNRPVQVTFSRQSNQRRVAEMPEDRAEGLAGQNVKASRKPGRSSAGHAEAGDRTQSDRSLTGNDDPEGPRGGDHPQNDRRKRGDLQKRGLP